MVISTAIPHQINSATKPVGEGISRAMLVLLALGKDNAAGVLEALEPKELEAITRSAAELQEIDVSGLENAAREFEKSFNDTPLEFLGTPDEVRAVLAMAGPKPLRNLPEITNRVSTWEGIAGIETERLTTYLNAQHPQAISLILSKLESDRAAEILGGFSSAQRNDLMARMLSLRAVAPDILEMVEHALDADLLQAPPADAVHHQSIADLLNRLDQQQSNEFLQHIQDVRPKDAVIVKRFLFQFSDLATLTAKSLSIIIDRLSTENIIVALHGTDAEFQAKVLTAIAPRARRMVEAELQSGATVTPRDVLEARRSISATVLRLVADGTIEINDGRESGTVQV